MLEQAERGDSGTREQGSPSAFEHPGSPRALERGYFSTLKCLDGWITLEQGSMSILEYLGYLNALEYVRVRSSRASMVVFMLVHNTNLE